MTDEAKYRAAQIAKKTAGWGSALEERTEIVAFLRIMIEGIRRVLPKTIALRAALEELCRTFERGHHRIPGHSVAEFSEPILTTITQQLLAETDKTPSADRAIKIVYRNHRGEVGTRRIKPITIWFGSSQWHPEPQWLMEAMDLEKNVVRDFALKDITSWGTGT